MSVYSSSCLHNEIVSYEHVESSSPYYIYIHSNNDRFRHLFSSLKLVVKDFHIVVQFLFQIWCLDTPLNVDHRDFRWPIKVMCYFRFRHAIAIVWWCPLPDFYIFTGLKWRCFASSWSSSLLLQTFIEFIWGVCDWSTLFFQTLISVFLYIDSHVGDVELVLLLFNKTPTFRSNIPREFIQNPSGLMSLKVKIVIAWIGTVADKPKILHSLSQV